MYMTDFEYDGRLLSEIGFMVAFVNKDTDDIQVGCPLTLNTVKNNSSFKNYLASAVYDDVLTSTFDVVKDTCLFDSDYELTDLDIRDITSWLQRRDYKRFKPMYNDASFSDMFIMGTFTDIKLISAGDRVVGVNLTLTANSPFAYANLVKREDILPLRVVSENDEFGSFYPDKVILTCSGGDVKLYNSLDSDFAKCTKIKNCEMGEVITLDCENKLISSDKEHKTLPNDFNYIFPKLVKEYPSDVNEFTGDGISKMEIEYYPIRKVGLII